MLLLLRLLGLRVTIAFLLLAAVKLEVRADVNFVVLVPPISEETDSASDGYFALAEAVHTVVLLAGQHINEDGSLLEGNLTLSVVHSATASEAAANLCSDLVLNGNSTTTVSSRC